jgi:ABC-type transporter Mla maintaining outer membrane lipid asymmetry ATPase subunit MlaF
LATRQNLLLPDVPRWPADRPVIELHDVTKRFDGRAVLDRLNLSIPCGKTTVIVGESGSGKSVLLKLMNGLLLPDEGTVTLFGKDLRRIDERERIELRKRCTMLFQSYALIDSMTVLDNIAFPLRENSRMPAPEIDRLVEALLARLELPHARNMMPSELSGGMKKRVSLARAIISNPEVVLFDEPTTGLDPLMIEAVDQLIIRTRQEYEITSVIISHDMASNRRLADHMAMLHGGKIIAEGTFEEVAAHPRPEVQSFMANISTERLQRDSGGAPATPVPDRRGPAVTAGDEDFTETETTLPRIAPDGDAVVVFDQLHKHFGGNHVLKGVSFTIPKRKISVIIGASGSGKSVCIKHIIGLLRPDGGHVRVFGQDLAECDEEGRRAVQARVGLLFQGAALFDSITVRDNIAFPLRERMRREGRLGGRKGEQHIAEQVEEMAEKLHVADILDRFPGAVSIGERKRVGLARAIITRPEIVIYDEPTTGQDPIMMKMVDDMIVSAAHTFQITSIVVSHDMPSTFRIADQIVMIHRGEVAAVGSPAAFRANPDERVQRFIYAGSDNPLPAGP